MLHIIKFSWVGLFEDIVCLLNEEELFVVGWLCVVGVVLFGEGYETGLDLLLAGVWGDVESLVVAEIWRGVKDVLEGG